jgi:hypothetical protein
MHALSLCTLCKHKVRGEPRCAAFPDGIPRRFLMGEAVHVKPAEGDGGVTFEPAADLSESERRLAARAAGSATGS